MPRRRGDPVPRFWSKVDKRGPDDCWEFHGANLGKGYRAFYWNGRLGYAHRFSYEIHNGPIPPDQNIIRHDCDNPPCVNPAHLFAGTHADNVADRHSKGRTGSNKLTADQVAEIKQDDRPGWCVAQDYGVGETAIRNIRNGRTWRDVPGTTPKERELEALALSNAQIERTTP